MGTQRELLELLEPGPALTPAMRRAVIPILAALLLEAVAKSTEDMADGTATEKGAGDEQDRA